MDRRVALKNLGLSLGYVVATPTLISIVQSCKSEPGVVWTPSFLTATEGDILIELVDLILPKTDTPSASEVNVHQFIDTFANDIFTADKKAFVKMSMESFVALALSKSGKTAAEDLTTADLEPVLAMSLNDAPEHAQAMWDKVNAYNEALGKEEAATLDKDAAAFAFAHELRGLTIWGYKSSEYVGEEVLAYLPVPGEYIGCEDTETLTQGKAWSL